MMANYVQLGLNAVGQNVSNDHDGVRLDCTGNDGIFYKYLHASASSILS